jgi:hypothetical protein
MSMQNSPLRDLLSLLGLSAQDERVVKVLDALGTVRRREHSVILTFPVIAVDSA